MKIFDHDAVHVAHLIGGQPRDVAIGVLHVGSLPQAFYAGFTVGIDRFELTAKQGGRLASLVAAGHELLVQPQPDRQAADPMSWGAYPMVPWAGRVANGIFTFEGTDVRLPINLESHSLHGTAFTSSWQQISPDSLELDLGDPWPYGGKVHHHAELNHCARLDRSQTDVTSLRLELTVTAGNRPMPAMVGWHPWFRRELHPGLPPVEVTFTATSMFELDEFAIPTGTLVDPPAGPWDNCFVLDTDPVLTWPGLLEVTLSSSCDYWVIFDHMDHAVCVEPQSGPPNQFSMSEPFSPTVLRPGQSFTHHFDITWRQL